ncbi:MAG: ABC transporter ATP-binding protein, partial [Oscillospiraceae bacterium]|nr:ABC transporter ATP-binding protein [Oscillospiraceae bacterium]
MPDTILKIENLHTSFRTRAGEVQAVRGVSLDLRRGEILGIVGESGCGKSVTAMSVLKVLPENAFHPAGRILLGEKDLLTLPPREMRKIRGDKISMIFQDPMTALNPVKTVADQISEVIRLHQKLSRADALRKACEMLELVGISAERINDYPHQFSGGMKQRVVIAIALACNPSLLIADEPTTALDVTIQAQVIEMMGRLKEELKTSMILITHDLGVVAE